MKNINILELFSNLFCKVKNNYYNFYLLFFFYKKDNKSFNSLRIFFYYVKKNSLQSVFFTL